MQLNGIDVSHWQGKIDWNAVKSDDISFAFVKATQGISNKDEIFADNWKAMHEVGLIRGAYHFYETDQDPIEQANHFLNTIGILNHTDFIICDIESYYGEYGSNGLSNNLKKWLEKVENATGKRPLIYTNPSFWEEYIGTDYFSDYPLWIANYGVDDPKIPAGWNYWLFWQYTQSGNVDGVDGSVDRNYCDLKALFMEYGKKKPIPAKKKKIIIVAKISIE